MNEAHKIGKKKNRLARLTRRIKACPADSNKIDRKNGLIYELGQAGVRV